MIEISINTPALLFPCDHFAYACIHKPVLSLASLVRKLHAEYLKGEETKVIIAQLKLLRARLNLIKYMQGFGVVSFLCCVLCMYTIFRGWLFLSYWIFAGSLFFLLISIILSLVEINKSTKALEIVLADIEELSHGNIFTDIFKNKED